MNFVICAIFKDEAPYLQEWIEFHRMVGFEHFYLYENGSKDNWADILDQYVRAGIATVIHWPGFRGCQTHAYAHFIWTHRGKDMVAAFLDCDEFLFSPCCDSVKEAVPLVPMPEDWGALAVNWMMFGASGRSLRTENPVISRFKTRICDSAPINRHVKCLVRMTHALAPGGDPHHFAVIGGTFSETGEPVVGAFSRQPSHRLLRINHYVTKSKEEFMERVAKGHPGFQSRDPSGFDAVQAPDSVDDQILRFLPQLIVRLKYNAKL